MNRIFRQSKTMACLLVILCVTTVTACESTETNTDVDRTIETLSGKDKIQQMNKMKADIDKINHIQAERLKQPE